uniref:Uncharacterized protein n=1 Tax=Aegilops tauschii TaxID=37682 RepID=M8CKH3_AEGTA
MDTKGSGAHREGEETGNSNAGAMTVAREYRRGNWTLPETMLLIEAKKRVHEERHPADLGLARWRWVEDYCWRAGCRRSQNQCNDRWDNLMRDYKKVRAYEHAGAGGEAPRPSYWEMARAERKARYLPSNLLREIYEAMGEIVERRMGFSGPGGPFLGAPPPPPMGSTGLVGVPMQASPLAQVQPRPLACSSIQKVFAWPKQLQEPSYSCGSSKIIFRGTLIHADPQVYTWGRPFFSLILSHALCQAAGFFVLMEYKGGLTKGRPKSLPCSV